MLVDHRVSDCTIEPALAAYFRPGDSSGKRTHRSAVISLEFEALGGVDAGFTGRLSFEPLRGRLA